MPAHSKRTPEMVEAILEGMSKGQTLTSLCDEQRISVQTWHDWRYADEALNIAHGRAREIGFDVIADDCLMIADTQEIGETRTVDPDGSIKVVTEDMLGHRKVRIETRLKLLAKWDPKRYGDKLEHSGTVRSELVQITPDEANL